MITKIQKLSAIHNRCVPLVFCRLVVYDYKDTKIVSNSQLPKEYTYTEYCCLWLQRYKNCQQFTTVVKDAIVMVGCLWLQRYKNCQQFTTVTSVCCFSVKLFMITKIQKLSAIHNWSMACFCRLRVVYDYKDTKIVSNSQLTPAIYLFFDRCLWLQRYKNCQQFTTPLLALI